MDEYTGAVEMYQVRQKEKKKENGKRKREKKGRES